MKRYTPVLLVGIAVTALLRADTPESEPRRNGPFNVRNFGAKGDGRSDDTAAIQAAIDAAIGPGDPKTKVREAKGSVYIPAGIYLVSRPLKIWSVLGMKFRGDGSSTILSPAGTMGSVLDINGAALCEFEDFRIRSFAKHKVENAIYYYWDPATSARSSMRCVFQRISIQGTNCVTAIRVGKPGAGVQVDQSAYRDLSLEGDWQGPRDPKLHRNGIYFGDGVSGNCLIHSAYNLEIFGWENAVVVDHTNMALWGGSFGNNTLDVRGHTLGYLVIQGLRSETSGRFFESGGPSTNPTLITISDIIWTANQIAPDGEFIRLKDNGYLKLSNVCVNFGPNAKIASTPQIGATIRLEGISSQNSFDGFLSGVNDRTTVVTEGFFTRSDAVGITANSTGLSSSGPLQAPSLDLGDGRKWDATGLYQGPGAEWTEDGFYPGPSRGIKWKDFGAIGPAPGEGLRYVGRSTDRQGKRRQGWIVPPLRGR